jgi:hypothetical protein
VDLLNPVPEVVAGRPIHAGPREAAVPGRPSFFSKEWDDGTWEDHLIAVSDDAAERVVQTPNVRTAELMVFSI